jgi:pyruvate-formate lyase-activating enzyme
MLAKPDLARIAQDLRDPPFPSRFAVELCAECNLRCSMCHHPAMRRPKGVMPFELWRKCADEIAAVAPKTQVWFSFCGEPLLEPEKLLRYVASGRQVGLQDICVNTNAMLLSRDLAAPLLDAGLNQLVIGLDGFSAETYAKIRVGGVRDVVYANVEHLLELRKQRAAGPEVLAQFIVMDENRHELDDFQAYWLARGAVVKARHMLSWGGKFGTPMQVGHAQRIACPWAVTMMHVFWDGRVPRCPGDTEGEEGAGNAWHESLGTLWRRLGAYRAAHLQHRFAELPERCQTCTDWMVGVAERRRPSPAQTNPNGGN